MQTAVVGSGIAGTTAAFLLAEQGHDVTLFEQAAACGPVGAGILLQPAGQAVLAELGLLGAVSEDSARIDALRAQHRSGRTLVHLEYGRLSKEMHGLGVHRGELYTLLLERARAAGVTICEGVSVVTYEQSPSEVVLRDREQRSFGPFDMVVAADGSRSQLRNRFSLKQTRIEYPYAALWLVGPWTGDESRLLQVVAPSGRLIGILPIGRQRASFFWGIWKDEWESVRTRRASEWIEQARAFYADCGGVIEHVTSMDDVTFATYRNVRLNYPVDRRVVFIGDAAHAMSPHLGQGTNLALADAKCLADQLAYRGDWSTALPAYARDRHRLIAYYSRLTAMLTPFFQTSNRVLQLGRDLTLPIMPRLPIVGREMLRTLAGVKRGWLG